MTYVHFAALLAALSLAVPAAAATVARAAPPSQGSVPAVADNKAAEAKPADARPAETGSKSAEVKSADEKGVDGKAVTVKPVTAKPGEAKPADPIGKKTAKPTAQGPAAAAATIAPPPAPEPEKPLTREEALKRANAFFNASPVMTADFVQIGGDGKRSEGKLHVQRAGRVRFEYAQPATMEVVADGAQVAVRDRKLNTQDLYFITQTPLKFLMKDKIDLEKDVIVEDVKIDDSGVTIAIEDKATFGGTSHVRLIFDPKTFKLKQWEVKDPQGYETLISIFNIDQAKVPDPALFKINK
ncbi:outer-membrane lipoprotein carrier protein LolA [Methylocystis sp.]|uniref:outer-membrane lipoprotein carrier protein LolA n=1 Tax=Methylocystis sp. TaxID=1911079 RepID=UPI002733AD4D|nr:outer-membrane lipoprotein carrier protein LolA [Methylocystis sp.]MDP3555113.1 outer-membrane lipoprotein carrier protein LolA [Methylocystis sp.]